MKMPDNELTYLHDLTDNELVSLAQVGDDNAYSVIIGRYIFLVRNSAAGYYSDSIEFDDLTQEGLIGLMNAVRGYDSKANTAFSTFAKLCVDRNIISAVRKLLRKKQIPQSMLVFIDDDDKNSAADAASQIVSANSDNPENAVIDRENYKRLTNRIFDKLSDTEIKVLKLYLAGNSYESIAKQLGLSEKSVDNAMQRLRKKLK